MKNNFFYFLGTFSIFFQSFGQSPVFINYNVQDGLASSEVYDILQDKKGFIWLATENGVSRFDGQKFKNFTTEEGLSDNIVLKLFEDSQDRVWFLTISGLPTYFQNNIVHKLNDFAIASFSASSIGEDKNNCIWLGTKGGVIKITNDRVHYEQIPRFKNEVVYILGKDSASNMWLTVPNSTDVFTYDYQKYHYVHFDSINGFIKRYVNNFFSSFKIINKTYRFNNGKIIVVDSTINSICNHIFDHLHDASILFLKEENNQIWVGTYNKGIYCFAKDKAKTKIIAHYFDKVPISSLFKDIEGNIWITTIGNGVYVLTNQDFNAYTISDGLTDNKIISITGDNRGNIWLGMNNGIVNVINKYGINKIDLKKELKYYKRVIDIIIEDNERVWLGLDEYIAIKQNNRFIIPRYPTDQVIFYYPIKCLAKSQDNRFFAGTNSSVIEIINQNNIIDLSKKYGIYPLRTNAILPDGNRIWVGTENGLYLFKDTASYYGLYDERLRSRITSLKKTARNNVIVGTIDKGVLFISYDGKIISQLSTKNGLLSNNCKMIFQENDSIIWIATSKGAHRINIDQVNSGSFIIKTYNTSNGLISDEVSGIYLRNDTAWIGTSNGVTFFHVYSKDNQNLLAPPIYINQVMINDSILHNNNEYFLSHFMNDIKINYIGLSYKNREEIFYKYKMEGVDSGWKYTSLSTIQFASLHPGKYIFSVFAKNYKGNWSDSPATITFTILPPWWQTWWFRGGVAAVAAGIIYLLFRWRVNVVRKQENTKTELNRKLAEMEMKALRAQMNPHFTFNSLNSIYHFISNNDVESAQKYMSRFASLMRGILDHSRLAYISVEEEIKMLKLYIELESLRFENKFDHEIIVDPSILSEQDEIPSMIIQPYVENAIWHGLMHKEDGKGRLKISIAKREGVIHCAIEDNGIGRARSAELKKSNRGQHKSVGMLITKERLDLLNEINQSSLSMKITDLFIDEKPAGTRVEIFIPVPAGVSSRRPTQTMAAEAGSG